LAPRLRILAVIQRLARVVIELTLNIRLGVPPVRVSGELRIASFANSERGNAPDPPYDPQIALGHD